MPRRKYHNSEVNVSFGGEGDEVYPVNSRGFDQEEADAIIGIYFKHCEHVSPEFRLDFARDLLDLVKAGKIKP